MTNPVTTSREKIVEEFSAHGCPAFLGKCDHCLAAEKLGHALLQHEAVVREEMARKCEAAKLPKNAWSLGIVPHSFEATRKIIANLIRTTKPTL